MPQTREQLAKIATAETRRQGALAANKRRRELSLTFRERLQRTVETELEGMLGSFRDAWLAGDWRAAQALIHEAYGLPVQRVEGERQVTIVVQSVLNPGNGNGAAIEGEATDLDA